MSGGTGLSRKIAGLPAWGWIAVAAAAGIVGYVWLQSRKNDNTTQPTDNGTGGEPGVSTQYASDVDQELLAQIRDLQGQNSTGNQAAGPLAAPSGLHATGVYTNRIGVAWTPVDGAYGYDVAWTDQKGGSNSAVVLGPYYSMMSLPRKYRYTIKVRARGLPGSSQTGTWSSPITVTTK